MKRLLISVATMAAAASLLVAGCSQPAPTPTQAPAKPAEPTKAAAPAPAPTKPAEPTKAAAPAPTAAPAAKKVDFPQKGKPITIIIPYNAGGPIDLVARLLAPSMEKELGVPVQIVNKPGGSTLVGITEMVNSKPDGHTLAFSSEPTVPITYLDPEAKATFGLKNIQPIARVSALASAYSVKADSPYKGMKDLVDAAKAKPEGVKFATTGMLTSGAFPGYFLEEAAGIKFAYVHFDGAPPAVTAVLGGHADVTALNPSVVLAQIKGGTMRAIGLSGSQETRFLPGVKTAEAQGYKAYGYSQFGVIGPAGIPSEVVDILTGTMKKVLESAEIKAKMDEQGNEISYLGPADYLKSFQDLEKDAQKVLTLVRGAAKK